MNRDFPEVILETVWHAEELLSDKKIGPKLVEAVQYFRTRFASLLNEINLTEDDDLRALEALWRIAQQEDRQKVELQLRILHFMSSAYSEVVHALRMNVDPHFGRTEAELTEIYVAELLLQRAEEKFPGKVIWQPGSESFHAPSLTLESYAEFVRQVTHISRPGHRIEDAPNLTYPTGFLKIRFVDQPDKCISFFANVDDEGRVSYYSYREEK